MNNLLAWLASPAHALPKGEVIAVLACCTIAGFLIGAGWGLAFRRITK